MGADKFFKAMKDVMLLSEEVKRLSSDVSDLSVDVRNIDRRLIRMETLADIAQVARQLQKGGPVKPLRASFPAI